MPERWFRGGAMASGSGAHEYGVLVHYFTNRGHGEDEWLTEMRLEWSTASGEAPKRVVDGGRDYREREDARVR